MPARLGTISLLLQVPGVQTAAVSTDGVLTGDLLHIYMRCYGGCVAGRKAAVLRLLASEDRVAAGYQAKLTPVRATGKSGVLDRPEPAAQAGVL